MVVLDTDAYDRMEQRGDERSQELILAHELGHVLGLDHVDDVDELMNAEYVGQDGFGPGDRDGLRAAARPAVHLASPGSRPDLRTLDGCEDSWPQRSRSPQRRP